MISDETISSFVSLTCATPDEARQYLEMTGGEVEQAVNLFLEMGAASPPLQPAQPPAGPSSDVGMQDVVGGGGGGVGSSSAVLDADVAAEVAAVAAAAGIDAGPLLPDSHMADIPEEDVRAPMPAYQDQIINPDLERRRVQEAIAADSAAMERRMVFDRPMDIAGAGAGAETTATPATINQSGGGAAPTPAAEAGGLPGPGGQAINQLFAPPAFNDPLPYLQVIEKAKAESKYILVNIQQAEVFASHQLNRDVWSDDTIKDIVQGTFIFWQRDDKSAEGTQFCSYYQCGHVLPHICIVDPRTRRCLKGWEGKKWVESHVAAEYLLTFLEDNSMQRTPVASPGASPTMEPHTDPAGTGGSGNMELCGLEAAAPAAAAPAVAAPAAAGAAAAAAAVPEEPVAAMPEEPAEDTQHLKVSFRMPSGARVPRRFLADDRVEQMFLVASAASGLPPGRIDLSTQFPTRSLRDVEGGLQALLKDVQVQGNMVLVSVRQPAAAA